MVEIIVPEVMPQFKPEESIEITKNSRGVNHSYKLIGTVEEQLKRIDNIEEILLSDEWINFKQTISNGWQNMSQIVCLDNLA